MSLKCLCSIFYYFAEVSEEDLVAQRKNNWRQNNFYEILEQYFLIDQLDCELLSILISEEVTKEIFMNLTLEEIGQLFPNLSFGKKKRILLIRDKLKEDEKATNLFEHDNLEENYRKKEFKKSMFMILPTNENDHSLLDCEDGRSILNNCEEGRNILKKCEEGGSILRNCDEDRSILRNCDEDLPNIKNSFLKSRDKDCRDCDEGRSILKNCEEGRSIPRNCEEGRSILRNCDEDLPNIKNSFLRNVDKDRRDCDKGRSILKNC